MQPRPLFNDRMSVEVPLEEFLEHYEAVSYFLKGLPSYDKYLIDFTLVRGFLAQHAQESNTFMAYRQSAERLVLWSWLVVKKSITTLSVSEITDFISFSKRPPDNWKSSSPRQRFFYENDGISFNNDWRPFNDGRSSSLSDSSLVQQLRICSALYNYLLRNGRAIANPVAALNEARSRSQKPFRAPRQPFAKDLWRSATLTAIALADVDPRHERALFVVMCIYYLRVRTSDLASSEWYTPLMSCFVKQQSTWRFELPGRRRLDPIAVSPDLLLYLERYRLSRGLSPLPMPREDVALLETLYGRPGLCKRQIRKLVISFLELVADEMQSAGFSAQQCIRLRSAPFSVLRRTGARDLTIPNSYLHHQ